MIIENPSEKEIILFVFEGAKTENVIYQSLQKYFLNEKKNTVIVATFKTVIYKLYNDFTSCDSLEFDLIEVLRTQNSEILNGITREDVTRVYLFFDYDGHATNASDEKLKKMLEYFNNETENGKLYISYPMVEAIKHLKTGVNFQTTVVDAKRNIKYKNLVHQNCDNIFKHIWELNHWVTIINEHCSKLNFIVMDNYVFPHCTFEQLEVFEAQLTKYIISENKVAVLSAFPVLLLDYYGAKGLHNKISSHLTTQQESI